MFMLLSIFRRLINVGTLRVIDPLGNIHVIEGTAEPDLTIRYHDKGIVRRMLLNPSMALGEGYMDGRITVENGQVYDLLALLSMNLQENGHHSFHKFTESLDMLGRRIHQYNPAGRSKQNVAHHYDLSGELYELFLDSDLQYSCAYFEDPENDIETAQLHKKRHLMAKLLPEKGQKVLDIGSGWGGLGLYIAKHSGASVTGVTLSEEQHKVSNERARKQGMAQQAGFNLRDYRDQQGLFDRIISVGMFEHVGVGHFGQFFSQMDRLLARDGIALLHTIGRTDPPTATDPWIRKYIFPGGYIPALSEIMPKIERSGLMITDIECLGLHYAETLKQWQIRFRKNRDRVKEIYDERFCRMWEYYLSGSEVSFRYLGLTVFQIQMTKRAGIVPMTRTYIGDTEKALDQMAAEKSEQAA